MRLATIVGDPEVAGDQADVSVVLVANDVRLASDLSDYTGEVDLRPTFRLTDLDNGPDGDAATVLDLQLSFRTACAATGDIDRWGGLQPGHDGRLGDPRRDQGVPAHADGGPRPGAGVRRRRRRDLDTPADNTLFLTQGIFIP